MSGLGGQTGGQGLRGQTDGQGLGRGIWKALVLPHDLSSGIGAAVAGLYAWATISLPDGLTSHWVAYLAVLCVGLRVLAVRTLRGALPTVRLLEAQSTPTTPQQLALVAREARAVPDTVFGLTLFVWLVSSPVFALLLVTIDDVSVGMGLRIARNGWFLAPMVAVLAYRLSVLSQRRVISKVLNAGLGSSDLLRALPPTRGQGTRRMLVAALLEFGTPLVLVLDLSSVIAEKTFSAMASAASSAERLAIAQAVPVDQLLISLGVVAGAIAMILYSGSLSGRLLAEPLRVLAEQTQRIASGRIGAQQLVPGEDELWKMSAAIVTLEAQVGAVVLQLKDAGEKISRATGELVDSSDRQEQGATEQSAALAETSATTEELARSAKQIASNASQVSALAEKTLKAARSGQGSAEAFYGAILKVKGGNETIADSVVKLNKRVQQVGKIVEFIEGIADKSDLLALNAELEGNKAGEPGRGFSLVAAEMRRLAENVMRSTQEISGLIADVRDATNAAVMATEAGVKASDLGSALAREVSESLKRIHEFAQSTSHAVQTISVATAQQQSGSDQLAQAMNEILVSTQAGANASKEMQSANQNLTSLSRELKTSVDRFEVQS